MIVKSIEFFGSCVRPAQYPKDDLPEVVVAGRSNVGKSSFINAILNNHKVARVSATPGKTRLLNFFLINRAFYLVDIPGYGYAAAPKTEIERFSSMIEEYFAVTPKLAIGILLLDFRRIPSADDLTMYAYYKNHGLPVTVVLTKADKLSNNERAVQLRAIRAALKPETADEILVFSSKTKENVDAVWQRIDQAVQS
ncbi:MAG: ribosome biogenesis GTP-binding protein YihA/YsxC [Candidatus Izemoplasmatales bacterium]